MIEIIKYVVIFCVPLAAIFLIFHVFDVPIWVYEEPESKIPSGWSTWSIDGKTILVWDTALERELVGSDRDLEYRWRMLQHQLEIDRIIASNLDPSKVHENAELIAKLRNQTKTQREREYGG